MRFIHSVLMGIVLVGLLFAVSCCCTGGIDDDDLNLPDIHDEGTGGN